MSKIIIYYIVCITMYLLTIYLFAEMISEWDFNRSGNTDSFRTLGAMIYLCALFLVVSIIVSYFVIRPYWLLHPFLAFFISMMLLYCIETKKSENEYRESQISYNVENYAWQTEYYDTGELLRDAKADAGSTTSGKYTTYYRNGKVKFIEQTNDIGNITGLVKGYYPNGQLMLEGMKIRDTLDGEWSYYNNQGKLEDIRQYKMGELISSSRYTLCEREINDTTYLICTIADHKPFSGSLNKTPILSKEYFPYYYTANIVEGDVLDSPFKVYFDASGSQLASSRNYINGQLEGEYKTYFESGKLHYTCTYKKGKRHGIARWWNENGILTHEQQHVAGLRHGYDKTYNGETGELQGEKEYANDECVD